MNWFQISFIKEFTVSSALIILATMSCIALSYHYFKRTKGGKKSKAQESDRIVITVGKDPYKDNDIYPLW